MAMQPLIFITGNPGKAKYLSDYFHMPVEHRKLDLHEIQSLNLREIVEDKVRRAYEIIQAPVFVEDVSLTFTALQRLPGPLIKWFLESLGNEGLCHLLNPFEDRSAIAEVEYAFYDGVDVYVFSGKRKGTIARSPRGEERFGWDPVFIPDGYEKTWAEMSGDEKHATSMRKIALEKLRAYLDHRNS